MRKATAIVLTLTVMFLTVSPCRADEPEVAPLMKGEPAPWNGLIVREGRFSKMLRLQVDLDEMSYKLQVREKLYQDMTNIYKGALDKAQAELNKRVKPEPWYKSHWLLFCIGVFVGMGATIGAVVGAAQLK
jgi:hypothetical protein